MKFYGVMGGTEMKKISALIISMALLFSTSVMGVSAKETVETKELYAAEQGETKKESAKENTNAEKISVASDSPVELKVINSWSDLKMKLKVQLPIKQFQ